MTRILWLEKLVERVLVVWIRLETQQRYLEFN